MIYEVDEYGPKAPSGIAESPYEIQTLHAQIDDLTALIGADNMEYLQPYNMCYSAIRQFNTWVNGRLYAINLGDLGAGTFAIEISYTWQTDWRDPPPRDYGTLTVIDSNNAAGGVKHRMRMVVDTLTAKIEAIA